MHVDEHYDNQKYPVCWRSECAILMRHKEKLSFPKDFAAGSCATAAGHGAQRSNEQIPFFRIVCINGWNSALS